MKVRINYVSNSSSSSFIISNFDKEKVKEAIDKYIATIDLNDEYNIYYKTTKELIKDCFMNKLNNSNEGKEDLQKLYLTNVLFVMFYNIFDYYISERQNKFIDCSNCKDKNNCDGCFFRHKKEWLNFKKQEIEYSLKNLQDFELKEDFNNIKKIVYDLGTTEREEEILVNKDYNLIHQLCHNLSLKYTQEWLKDHQNSFVMQFSSDIGITEEALIRCNIDQFVNFMKKEGIDGLRGENS